MLTKKCPDCGKNAISIMTGHMQPMNPPNLQYHFWCKCGYTSEPYWEKQTQVTRIDLWNSHNKPYDKYDEFTQIMVELEATYETDKTMHDTGRLRSDMAENPFMSTLVMYLLRRGILKPEKEPVIPQCYACKGRADDKCEACGKPVCGEHSGITADDCTLCDKCTKEIKDVEDET